MKAQLCSHSSICTAFHRLCPALHCFTAAKSQGDKVWGRSFPHFASEKHVQEANPHAGGDGLRAGREQSPQAALNASRRDPLPLQSPAVVQSCWKDQNKRNHLQGTKRRNSVGLGELYLQRRYLLTICTDQVSGWETLSALPLACFPLLPALPLPGQSSVL